MRRKTEMPESPEPGVPFARSLFNHSNRSIDFFSFMLNLAIPANWTISNFRVFDWFHLI
jgi:hypothetical protein